MKNSKAFFSAISAQISIEFGTHVPRLIPRTVIATDFQISVQGDDVINVIIKTSNGFLSPIYGPISIKFVTYIPQDIRESVTVGIFEISILGR